MDVAAQVLHCRVLWVLTTHRLGVVLGGPGWGVGWVGGVGVEVAACVMRGGGARRGALETRVSCRGSSPTAAPSLFRLAVKYSSCLSGPGCMYVLYVRTVPFSTVQYMRVRRDVCVPTGEGTSVSVYIFMGDVGRSRRRVARCRRSPVNWRCNTPVHPPPAPPSRVTWRCPLTQIATAGDATARGN